MRLVSGASKMRVLPFGGGRSDYRIIATPDVDYFLSKATIYLREEYDQFRGLNIYDYYISNLFQIL